MRPNRLLKTESFRSAALIGAVDADISTIRNGNREKGISEAIEVVLQRLGAGDYAGRTCPAIGLRDSRPGLFIGMTFERPAGED